MRRRAKRAEPALLSFSSFCSNLLSLYSEYCKIVSETGSLVKVLSGTRKRGVGSIKKDPRKVVSGNKGVSASTSGAVEKLGSEKSGQDGEKDGAVEAPVRETPIPSDVGKEVVVANAGKIQSQKDGISFSSGARTEVIPNQIFVSNLPFETSAIWVRNVFGPFGSIISVSVPRRPSTKGRYFGFVTFKTNSAASQAVDSLNGYKINGHILFVALARPRVGYHTVPKQSMIIDSSISGAHKAPTTSGDNLIRIEGAGVPSIVRTPATTPLNTENQLGKGSHGTSGKSSTYVSKEISDDSVPTGSASDDLRDDLIVPDSEERESRKVEVGKDQLRMNLSPSSSDSTDFAVADPMGVVVEDQDSREVVKDQDWREVGIDPTSSEDVEALNPELPSSVSGNLGSPTREVEDTDLVSREVSRKVETPLSVSGNVIVGAVPTGPIDVGADPAGPIDVGADSVDSVAAGDVPLSPIQPGQWKEALLKPPKRSSRVPSYLSDYKVFGMKLPPIENVSDKALKVIDGWAEEALKDKGRMGRKKTRAIKQRAVSDPSSDSEWYEDE